MSNTSALDAIADEQGWDYPSLVGLLTGYIDSLPDDHGAFEQYLRDVAANENEALSSEIIEFDRRVQEEGR